MGAAGPRLSALSCDRCGAPAVDRYHFCQRCGLFVCDRCWQADAEACLSCTRPGLPVGGELASAIQTTLGRPSPPAPGVPPASRVARTLAASTRAQRDGSPRPAPVARASPPIRPTDRLAGLIRVVALSAVLGVVLLLLPALFGSPGASPSPSSDAARPTATARPTRPSATPEPARTYVVRRGDTLRSIAARMYGDANLWRRILRANLDRLESPEELRIGMTLRIPALR